MQPRAPAERSKEIHSTGFTNKEVLQRLKSPKTPWQSIAQLLLEAQKVRTNLNLVVVTAAIAAYGRSQSWQHALEIFGSCSGLSGLRLDAVAISACVAAVAARWSLALWTLQRGRLMALDPAPRGITSAAMACGQGEWMWSLRLSQGGTSCSIQTLTASLMACEKTGRWSTAVAVLCRAVDGRLQADQVAVNGVLNACGAARQWQRCLEMTKTTNKDAVMTNILSKACGGPWAWIQAVAALDFDAREGRSRLLPGLSAVMQSVQWPTAVEFLKKIRRFALKADAMACSSFLKTLESAGHWPRSLQSLQENDQRQLAPDALLYNTLVSSSEKCSDWKAAMLLFTLRVERFGMDTASASAAVLACCQSSMWPWALELLSSLERSSYPPSSHALAAVLSVVEEIPEVEVAAFSMLAHALVDGVAPPQQLLQQLQAALLGAAAYRHPHVTPPSVAISSRGSRQGLYRYSKELRLLRHVVTTSATATATGATATGAVTRVCEAIESFGSARSKRWLKVAGTQKAKVLEAVVAGVAAVRPAKILEIGTYCGYSALRMLLSVESCHRSGLQIHSLEADPIHAAVACNVLKAAGVTSEEIRIHIGHSKTLLPTWPSTAQFRAVFMDQRGSRYDEDLTVLEERKLLAPGACVVADNVLKPGAPRLLWKLCRHSESQEDTQDVKKPPYHVQIISLKEFAMPSEDWMTVSIGRGNTSAGAEREVPKITELHHSAEAMRDLASKPGGSSVSFDEWRSFAWKMKQELKLLGIQATVQLDDPGR